jgi:AmmeMemoRadiSam system protein B/AmmeMemoRadiSam system protein A
MVEIAGSNIRKPYVAGTFYPEARDELRAAVIGYLEAAAPSDPSATIPKAIIAPHAGYVYSGAVAASAYARLVPGAKTITRVVLAGPSHRVPFKGIAVPSVDGFESPLGPVAIDRDAVAQIAALPFVVEMDEAHAMEHSLEVHIPFLQTVLEHFTLVPLVVGDAGPGEVAQVLNALWGGPETVLVISSDLSHYEDYDTAQKMDGDTARAIAGLAVNDIAEAGACGGRPIRGLLAVAQRRGMRGTMIDLRNSGDTAGPKDRVVGYGSFVFEEQPALSDAARASLLDVVREAITGGLGENQEPQISVSGYSDDLLAPRATFVTLTKSGKLRGCIGSLVARQPLVVDVAHNAFRAAFKDPRFPPVSARDLTEMTATISVLSPATEIAFDSESSLLAMLRPGVDGVILAEGERRGTFLPDVWETRPNPVDFLNRLKGKAGLPGDYWSETLKAWRYTTEIFSEPVNHGRP